MLCTTAGSSKPKFILLLLTTVLWFYASSWSLHLFLLLLRLGGSLSIEWPFWLAAMAVVIFQLGRWCLEPSTSNVLWVQPNSAPQKEMRCFCLQKEFGKFCLLASEGISQAYLGRTITIGLEGSYESHPGYSSLMLGRRKDYGTPRKVRRHSLLVNLIVHHDVPRLMAQSARTAMLVSSVLPWQRWKCHLWRPSRRQCSFLLVGEASGSDGSKFTAEQHGGILGWGGWQRLPPHPILPPRHDSPTWDCTCWAGNFAGAGPNSPIVAAGACPGARGQKLLTLGRPPAALLPMLDIAVAFQAAASQHGNHNSSVRIRLRILSYA